MVHKKLASFAAAAVTGAMLIAAPTLANARGGFHGGGFHGGFARAHVGGFHGGFARGPVFAHRAFFPHRRFFARPFVGAGIYGAYAADYSCWRWVPTAYGLQRVWVCGGYY
jgi:hypothetical protein